MFNKYKRWPYSEEIRSAVSAYLAGEYDPSLSQREQFEQEFSKFIGMDYCFGVSSGSAALHLALIACGVGAGDEVVTAANTCHDVADAISWCGAKPILVDVEPETYNMNPHLVESVLTSRTKAIIPPHMYGHPIDMNPISEIAEQSSLLILDDAAQALGAIYRGKKVGTLGNIGCFSLSKGLAGYGGIVATQDEKIASYLDMLNNRGHRRGFPHRQEIIAYRYCLNELCALINRFQLKMVDEFIENRRQNAQIYTKLLQDLSDIILPVEKAWAKHVYFRFVLRIKRIRNELREYLLERSSELLCPKGIELRWSARESERARGSRGARSSRFYDQKPYKKLGFRPDIFPVTERLSGEIISLPIHQNLQVEYLNRISKIIHNFYQKKKIC